MFSMSIRSRPAEVPRSRVPCRRWALLRATCGPSAVGGKVFAHLQAQDDHAVRSGWTVGATRWGGRTYRDPRFDGLSCTIEPREVCAYQFEATAAAVAR